MAVQNKELQNKILQVADSTIKQMAATDGAFARALKDKESIQVAINSSFLYREKKLLKTTKSGKCLIAVLVDKGGKPTLQSVKVGTDLAFNKHYRILGEKEEYAAAPLPEAVTEELDVIGDVVFVLIGSVTDRPMIEQDVSGGTIIRIRFDPDVPDGVQLEDGICIVSQVLPIEDLFKCIEENLKGSTSLAEGDRGKIAKAYDQLLDAVTIEVSVPAGDVIEGEETILGRVLKSLQEQLNHYKAGIAALQKNPQNSVLLHEVLRIAYNFTTDIQPMLFFLMSICDLKPLVFWNTVDVHWRLHLAFSSLPWAALGRKEKFSEYRDLISMARNQAFHHVFPFDGTIEVNLERVDVRAEKLFLFPVYREKKRRGIRLKDQEIIDLFTEFSRAKERPVSLEFWSKNYSVIAAACDVIQATIDALALINRTKYPK